MLVVGVRELKKPPGQVTADTKLAALAELAKRGVLLLGADNDAALYPRTSVRLPRPVVEALLEQERGRSEPVRRTQRYSPGLLARNEGSS
jgi:hypothetical protein